MHPQHPQGNRGYGSQPPYNPYQQPSSQPPPPPQQGNMHQPPPHPQPQRTPSYPTPGHPQMPPAQHPSYPNKQPGLPYPANPSTPHYPTQQPQVPGHQGSHLQYPSMHHDPRGIPSSQQVNTQIDPINQVTDQFQSTHIGQPPHDVNAQVQSRTLRPKRVYAQDGTAAPMQAPPPPTSAQNSQPYQPGVHPQRQQPLIPNVPQPSNFASQKPKIDPTQIPSPIHVQDKNQEVFTTDDYITSSRGMIPLASSDYRAIDDGNANPRFLRLTLQNIPSNEDLLKSSQLLMGMVVQPLATLRYDEPPILVVDHGQSGPIRCRRCRGYINPFCTFIDGGRKFICNLCGSDNEVPAEYFCNLDINGRRLDVDQRPELKYGTVEFTTTQEYCNRPPVPASYVFAIDVSWNSIQSGMLFQTIQAIKNVLYDGNFPSDVKVAILTYDKNIHFYNIQPSLEQAQMMVVADIDDVFVPLSDNFVVDPNESRSIIESLLDSLPMIFQNNRTSECCIGAVVKSVQMALSKTGGKLMIFHTSLPTYGPGALKHRDDPKLIGTEKENTLYAPQDVFYPNLAASCVDAGISVDLFLFPNAYIDLATIGSLANVTGGQIFFYPRFDAARDGFKLMQDIKNNVTKEFGYNAVLRVRCSDGLNVEEHIGNFYMRNNHDVELAGIDSDKAIGVILKHDFKLDERQDSSFQVALLYTTSSGERRVRVHNISVPCTSSIGNLFRNAEADTTVNLMAKLATNQLKNVMLKDLRDQLTRKCVRILYAYRKYCASSSPLGQLILPETLKLLPLYTLTIAKSKAIRSGVDVNSDIRSFHLRSIKQFGVAKSIPYFYPRIFQLNEIPPNGCDYDQNGKFIFPPLARASIQFLQSEGAYLLENADVIFLWLGRHISREFLQSAFGVSSLEEIDVKMRSLPNVDSRLSQQIKALMEYIFYQRGNFLSLQIVRQQIDQAELEFLQLLVEDKHGETMNYVDYLCYVHREIQAVNKS